MKFFDNPAGTDNSAENKVVRYIEKRGEDREYQKAPILVQELSDIYIYGARMVNYSDKGVYIETDTALGVGTDIIIGIEDSTFISPSASPSSPKFYHAKIIWRKNLTGGFFKFGYGTKFVYFEDKLNAPKINSKPGKEYRKHPRKLYSKPVIFRSMNKNYKGSLSNISRGGAFIEAQEPSCR